jgi:hypothetical protein
MSCGKGTTLSLLVLVGLGANFVHVVDANAFLKANPVAYEERISEEEVRTSLLEEVEGTFGAGAASSRLKQLETDLAPMYAALPKNQHGHLGHATVRYALHRLFVQRHGWIIKGLHTAGEHRNATSSAGLLKEQVPGFLQELFEERLGGQGFGVHELAVLAATIEHLVHKEAIKRLGEAFKVHGHLPTSLLTVKQLDNVLDTYMIAYILNEPLWNMTLHDAITLRQEMPELFGAWNATQKFVREVRANITRFESSEEQKAGAFDFALVAHVAERIGELFGRFQDHECQQIRSSMLAIEDRGTGRVKLTDFYRPALDGSWQFQESKTYLRQLGALDESETGNLRVIIPNYVHSPSNCIASSSFYSVCCIDECESLFDHLERQIAAPEATSEHIAMLVSKMSSSTVTAPRELSKTLKDRLEAIDSGHGGKVPLHGRLFAQWMSHAFPRECPFPHVSGTTNPQTPDEWLESTGEETVATLEEIKSFMDSADNQTAPSQPVEDVGEDLLPWSPEEELLVVRPAIPEEQRRSTWVRGIALFAAVMGITYSLVVGWSSTSTKSGKGVGADKMYV